MSGEITSIHAYLLAINSKVSETKAEAQALKENLDEVKDRIDRINSKLDELKEKADIAAGRQSVIGGIAGLVGGGVVTWAARHFAVVTLFVLASTTAMSQEHSHPPQDEEIHEKFYRTWMMPDEPTKSCCNKADCYPTEVRFDGGGRLWAKRREDGQWLLVPEKKIERDRDNPDGRNHMCAPPPTAAYYPPNTVFCLSLGGGT